MTFPWPFKDPLSSNGRNYHVKNNEMHPDLPNFWGYIVHMFYYDQFMTHVEGVKTFTSILIASQLKIIVKYTK